MPNVTLVFNLNQLALVQRALSHCEALVAHYYRIPVLPSHQYPYELVTLDDLRGEERVIGVLAHLVIYERQRKQGPEYLYRICLQDDLILQRSSERSEIGLRPMLVYILTHELVHVVRFQRSEQSFIVGQKTRREEEEQVHQITLDLLKEANEPHCRHLDQLLGNPMLPVCLVN